MLHVVQAFAATARLVPRTATRVRMRSTLQLDDCLMSRRRARRDAAATAQPSLCYTVMGTTIRCSGAVESYRRRSTVARLRPHGSHTASVWSSTDWLRAWTLPLLFLNASMCHSFYKDVSLALATLWSHGTCLNKVLSISSITSFG